MTLIVLTNDRGPVLEFQKRTGYLLVAALLGHLLLISAQVSSQQGASVLETTIFGALVARAGADRPGSRRE